jgi:HPt (histidine-containing phosphotransfer) domain-containing protein
VNPTGTPSPLNLARLDDVTEGNLEFGRELVSRFLAACDGRLEEIEEGLRQLDATAVERAAHALKGTGRSIGADGAAEVCARIEELAGQCRLGDAADLVVLLRTRINELRAAAAARFPEVGP